MDNNNSNNSSLDTATIVKIAAFVAFLVIGGILLTNFMPDIFPPQASAEAENADNLFEILLILGGIVFFLIQGLLVISVIAFRARPGDNSDGVATHGNMTLEIVWTIIPSIVVVFLSIMSFNVWNQNTTPKENENMINGDSVPINVVGARYAWAHTYDTPEVNILDEPIVINSGTELHTYVGQNVHLSMQSQDVIHSYWIPAMRVKQDLLPGNPDEGGRITEIRFTPIKIEGETYPAQYPIVCAELCGDGHGRMTGKVYVYENEEQFLEMYYEPTVEALRVPPSDPVERGESTLSEYACNGCHLLDDLGWIGATGPSLNAIGVNAGSRKGGYTAEDYLVESIWSSSAYLVPGYQNLMPKFGPDEAAANEMTSEELYAIVAYLCAIPSPEESSCDVENASTVIPAAIDKLYGKSVDITFGLSDVTGDAEATEEPDADSDTEATEEPQAEATDEPEDSGE